MQDVHCLQEFADHLLRVGDRCSLLAIDQFRGEHLVTKFEDAVDLLLAGIFVLDDVEQTHKCIVIYELAEKGNFAHGRVIDPIGHILSK